LKRKLLNEIERAFISKIKTINYSNITSIALTSTE